MVCIRLACLWMETGASVLINSTSTVHRIYIESPNLIEIFAQCHLHVGSGAQAAQCGYAAIFGFLARLAILSGPLRHTHVIVKKQEQASPRDKLDNLCSKSPPSVAKNNISAVSNFAGNGNPGTVNESVFDSSRHIDDTLPSTAPSCTSTCESAPVWESHLGAKQTLTQLQLVLIHRIHAHGSDTPLGLKRETRKCDFAESVFTQRIYDTL